MDYKSIELRILAHLSGDPQLIKILRESSDVFTALASTWFGGCGIQCPSGSGTPREISKRVAYAIIYGTTAMGLSKQLEIPVARAQTLKRSFLSFFGGVGAFTSAVKAFARERGYVETILKRKRFLPHISSQDRQEREAAERKAVNTVVQGSAADLIKCAMVRWKHLSRDKEVASAATLVAQIHDELLFEIADRGKTAQVAARVRDMMCTVFKLKVPVEVNCQFGPSWGDLQDLDF